MAELGLNLRVSGCYSQGGRKYMEDSICIAAQKTEDQKEMEYAFFAVYDGHGGKEASLFAKEHLMDNIVDLRYFWSEDDSMVLKAIRDGFLATHLAMWKELEKWPKTATGFPSTAGTTASVAFIRNGKLYTGHVGDSRIVLGHSNNVDQTWLAQSLTTDHKPETAIERKRIYESGGLIVKKSGIDRIVWKRPKSGHQGPVRRSTDFEKVPFLAVARSLGDLWSYDFLHKKFVVSPEPDVSVISLDPNKDHCLIVASDGLWNTLTPLEAVALVQEAKRENDRMASKLGTDPKDSLLNSPSKVLVNSALERWNKLKLRADNTSVIVILFDPVDKPGNADLHGQDYVTSVMIRVKPGSLGNSQSSAINENYFPSSDGYSSCLDKHRYRADDAMSSNEESGHTVENHSYLSDPSMQRFTGSPLQSLNISSDRFSLPAHHSVQRYDEWETENNPYPIPRWSKSASGQTSLSKLARWSMYINHNSTNSLKSFPFGHHTKVKKQNSENGKYNLVSSTSTQFSDSWKELCDHHHLSSQSISGPTKFRHLLKRKYSCDSHLDSYTKCEYPVPWKRSADTNSLKITAFKAINEFRMSQYHRLKF